MNEEQIFAMVRTTLVDALSVDEGDVTRTARLHADLGAESIDFLDIVLSLAEDHFADHFPGFPVMPAPLILEGLAQTGGILVGEANKYQKNVVLAKMSAKFHRDALAGEQLTYTTTIVDLNETGARVSATVH